MRQTIRWLSVVSLWLQAVSNKLNARIMGVFFISVSCSLTWKAESSPTRDVNRNSGTPACTTGRDGIQHSKPLFDLISYLS
jgi:hypothetical protein